MATRVAPGPSASRTAARSVLAALPPLPLASRLWAVLLTNAAKLSARLTLCRAAASSLSETTMLLYNVRGAGKSLVVAVLAMLQNMAHTSFWTRVWPARVTTSLAALPQVASPPALRSEAAMAAAVFVPGTLQWWAVALPELGLQVLHPAAAAPSAVARPLTPEGLLLLRPASAALPTPAFRQLAMSRNRARSSTDSQSRLATRAQESCGGRSLPRQMKRAAVKPTITRRSGGEVQLAGLRALTDKRTQRERVRGARGEHGAAHADQVWVTPRREARLAELALQERPWVLPQIAWALATLCDRGCHVRRDIMSFILTTVECALLLRLLAIIMSPFATSNLLVCLACSSYSETHRRCVRSRCRTCTSAVPQHNPGRLAC